ncbi:MAG: hypothetical protein RIG63_07985 [Coleofasciculus chthonoplastes F3-SA18-01]
MLSYRVSGDRNYRGYLGKGKTRSQSSPISQTRSHAGNREGAIAWESRYL